MLASYLQPKTFLAGRYIIGRLLSYNGEGALYLAFDTKNSIRVTIKEYMPDTLCRRKKGEDFVTVNPESIVLYKTYLAEFTDLNHRLKTTPHTISIQRVLDVFQENNTAYAVFEFIEGTTLKTYLASVGGKLSWE